MKDFHFFGFCAGKIVEHPLLIGIHLSGIRLFRNPACSIGIHLYSRQVHSPPARENPRGELLKYKRGS